MLITIPLKRRTCLWDPATGAVTRLSPLESALLSEVPRPMPPACPTAVRYAVAKYDSAEVDEAYAALRARFAEAEKEVATPRLVLEAVPYAEAVLRAAASVYPGTPIALVADDETRVLARTLGVTLA